MGREVRRVIEGWEHPKDEKGNYVPLFGRPYSQDLEEWIEGKTQWDKGFRKGYLNDEWIAVEDEYKNTSYREWSGMCPDKSGYMPEWPKGERTHIQMYEDTTEGTPISPVMETPEELARWLADNQASFFGGDATSYEHWLDICRGGIGLPMFVIPKGGEHEND